MKSNRQRIFADIANFSSAHASPLIWGTLILSALCALLISRLQFQSDVAHLLPTTAPKTQASVKFLKEFGAADSLFIALAQKSGGEMDAFIPFAANLAERLMATGEITEIHGWMDKESREKLAEQFIPKALLYLSPEDRKALEERLSDPGIEKQIRELKTKLHSPLGSLATQWLVNDPLELGSLFRKYLPAGGEEEMDSPGILLFPDRKMILLVARPRGSASDVAYDEQLVKKLISAQDAAREDFRKSGETPPDASLQGLTVQFAGGFISALEDSRMIRKELMMNFALSLIGVLVLFFYAFRNAISFLYAGFPLGVSPLLTLGLFSPFLGRLSESTGAFSAIILGLSIDFIILLYARYLEERKAGKDVPAALGESLGHTGPGIFTGAVTTVAAYYALLYSSFRGVQELGILTGTGILVSMVCAFLLLPALITWREKKKKGGISFRRVYSFGLEHLSPLALRGSVIVLSLGAALTGLSLLWISGVKVNNDPRSLRPEEHPSLLLEERIQEKMGHDQQAIIVLAASPTIEEALEIQGRLKKKFEEAVASGLPIARFETLAALIPPFSLQKSNLAWIAAREKGPLDPGRVEKKIKETLEREGLRAAPFAPGLRMLSRMLGNRELLTWEQFQGSPLGKLGERFLRPEENAYGTASSLEVKPAFWGTQQAGAFLDGLKEISPSMRITGSKLVQTELEDLMSRESLVILFLSLLLVSALLYFDFRSWILTLLSLLPVVLASVWTLGIMGLLGMNLNFMNLIVFSMVLGIGVDYGVHLIHRWLESNGESWKEGLIRVNRGIVLAALTTLVSFGTLVFSGYPGLQSMGAVALMGVGFSALIALTLIPVLLQKLFRSHLE
ncbi:MAG: MMPL family transporter [Deltaproteobacteria bacterium]|nr:MMPL family transporter [Deltaproteobacteria bacterium]